MAQFAKIDKNNIVVDVVVTDDNHPDGDKGQSWLEKRLGGIWLNAETSKTRAGIGYKYYSDLDAFIPPQPFKSWTLNEELLIWQAPIPYPQDGTIYQWDEDTLDWKRFIGE